jgi:EmrB/QacA subfamily drug resistance transporter
VPDDGHRAKAPPRAANAGAPIGDRPVGDRRAEDRPAATPSPHVAPEPRGHRRKLVLTACLIATFMAAVESTIVATTIPTIVSELGGFNLYSWVFTIYLLTQAVSIPVYGRLADLYGRKPVIFAGIAMFLTGSSLCGLAWDMPSLVAFRGLEGLGAGAIQPIAATILGDIYSPTERGRIQGLVSSVFGVAAVIGPSMGAFLIQHVSWRVVFWINIPIGLSALVMLGLFLRENVDRRQHRIDWLGSCLLLVAFGTLMLAMVQSGSMGPATLIALVAAGCVALTVLFLHERSTPEPMLPLELWRTNRIIVVGSLGSCFAGAVMMGVSAFLPAYIQGAMGGSAIDGGLVLGAMSVSWALSSILGARIMVRTSYRLVALLGAASLVAGCLMLVFLTPEDGPVWASLGSFVIGIGMGFANTVFIVSIQASVPWRQRGAATSSSMFLRFVGQSVGAAGCGAVLNATMLSIDPDAVAAVDQMLHPATRAALPPEVVSHLTAVIAASLHNAYLLAALFALVTLAVAWQLPARLSPKQQVKSD